MWSKNERWEEEQVRVTVQIVSEFKGNTEGKGEAAYPFRSRWKGECNAFFLFAQSLVNSIGRKGSHTNIQVSGMRGPKLIRFKVLSECEPFAVVL